MIPANLSPSRALNHVSQTLLDHVNLPREVQLSGSHLVVLRLAIAEIADRVEALEQVEVGVDALTRQLRNAEATIDRLSAQPRHALPPHSFVIDLTDPDEAFLITLRLADSLIPHLKNPKTNQRQAPFGMRDPDLAMQASELDPEVADEIKAAIYAGARS